MEVNKCFVTLLPWLGVKEWRFIHEPSRLHYMDSFIELLGKRYRAVVLYVGQDCR